MPTPCEYKTVKPPILVYGGAIVLTALVRLKAKQAKYDLNLHNETKGERIDMRTTGKPGAALAAQLKSRSKR
jgi:hypothetical protein